MNCGQHVLLKSRLKGKDVFGFKGQSELYASYRPKYPQVLIDFAATHWAEKNTLLDIGWGPGILSFPYSKIFEKVYGIDASQSQIDTAITKGNDIENASFYYENWHDIENFWSETMHSNPIDLVIVGQVLHWLDHDVIFNQYKSFMQESGAFAIFSYAINQIMNPKMTETIKEELLGNNQRFQKIEANNFDEDRKYSDADSKANDAFNRFYQTIKPHFEWNRDHVDNHYEHINFYDYFGEVNQYIFYDVQNLSLRHFILYLKTESGYRCFLAKFPDEKDPLDVLIEEISDIYHIKSDEELDSKMIDVVYPYYLGILKY